MKTIHLGLHLAILICHQFTLDAKPVYEGEVQIVQGFIIVQAQVNGQLGNYIIDTGSPGLVLNCKHFPEVGRLAKQINGIGGSIDTYEIDEVQFTWQEYNTEKSAYLIDLAYLERATMMTIHGLVGVDVFGNHRITINYQTHKIQLGSAEGKGCAPEQTWRFEIIKEAHLILIQLVVKGKKRTFVIDSGSKSNLIDRSVAEELSILKVIDSVAVIGADQSIVASKKVVIGDFENLPSVHQNLPFILYNMDFVNSISSMHIDGIIGHEFLQRFKMVIDKRRQNLYFHKYPYFQGT